MTIHPTRLALLRMDAPTQPGRPAYVAAASGLAVWQGRLFTVADDERALAEFSLEDPSAPGRWWSLGGGGPLPLEHHARKAAKPDLEALVVLARGELLAIGSGSAPRRNVAASVTPPGQVTWRDLSSLYGEVARYVPSLNIEGAFTRGDALWLIQRGNSAGGVSALIELDASLTPGSIRAVHRLTLPLLDGVPLTPTDGTVLPDGRVVLSASAEDTLDPYADGTVTGSALVVLAGTANVDAVLPLDGPFKIEGLTVVGDALWVVTDADDPDQPAQLLSIPLATIRKSDE